MPNKSHAAAVRVARRAINCLVPISDRDMTIDDVALAHRITAAYAPLVDAVQTALKRLPKHEACEEGCWHYHLRDELRGVVGEEKTDA